MSVEDLSNGIIEEAQNRIEEGQKYQNINSAIHAVKLEISNILMDVMRYTKGE